MQHGTVRFYLLLLLHPVILADPDEADEVALEVITVSSPCSTTCGVGIKNQTLCLLKDGKTAMEEKVEVNDKTKVSPRHEMEK